MRRIVIALTIGLGTIVWLSVAAQAQVSPSAMFQPFSTGLSFESTTDATFENAGHSQENGQSMRLDMYETQGRYEFTDAYAINPTFGWDAFYLDINPQDHALLPRRLVDTSVEFATPIAQYGKWFTAAAMGVGYAGDAPYAQSDGYYGRATALVGRQLGEDSALIFGLDYNGNRTEYSDIPLPGFAYSFRYLKTVSLSIGFPYDSVIWRPTDLTKLEVDYEFGGSLTAQATYELAKPVRVYGRLNYIESAYHLDNLPHDTRFFFSGSTAELGVRLTPCRNASIDIGGGWAFNQKFKEGWDFDTATGVDTASDEAFLHLGLELRL
jgi:hypothetical protein